MTDPRPIIIAVSNNDGDWLTVEVPPDVLADDLAHAFRTVAFWLTFNPDDVIPDPLREWGYADEK
jgi:hypothetical protein